MIAPIIGWEIYDCDGDGILDIDRDDSNVCDIDNNNGLSKDKVKDGSGTDC